MHESYLVYRNFRYLKLAAALVLVSLGLYVWHDPAQPPNGGTWLGYTLGVLGAGIILLLLWFGVRKRQYHLSAGKVQGWLSAHVYLGASLTVIATLHAGFQFGWNVHTLAYALMWIVILSGFFGVYAYLRYPRLMTENRKGATRGDMLAEIDEIDRNCLELADRVDHELHDAVLYAISHTVVGGSAREQVTPRHDFREHADAVSLMASRLASAQDAQTVETLRSLQGFMRRKLDLVRQLERDIQHQAVMEIWLYFHVPVSVALLGALIAHVFSVFYYW